jgi:hypothetical protein
MPPKRTATSRTASSGWTADAAGAASVAYATALIARVSLDLTSKGAVCRKQTITQAAACATNADGRDYSQRDST